MKFAFVIFKYFPYGGAQRDLMRIAKACVAIGHEAHIYTMSWNGPQPEGLTLHLMPGRGLMNHWRYRHFIAQVYRDAAQQGFDLMVGFNRMAGLDAYFAADPCYAESLRQRSFLHRWSGRSRWFAACEREVFRADGTCRILLLSAAEQAHFQRWYGTPDERFHLLPPYLSAERMAPGDRDELRLRLRASFGYEREDHVMLLVGSGFRTKGLDRAILGLAALPPELRQRTRLLAIGQDNPKVFVRQAAGLGLASQVTVVAGRDDVPQLMQGADLLVHPARRELAGHVLLEAMACGLPVLTTDVCGYSPHIEAAGAGKVLPSPFDQSVFDQAMAEMLASPAAEGWSMRGRAYAARVIEENDGYVEARILERQAIEKRSAG